MVERVAEVADLDLDLDLGADGGPHTDLGAVPLPLARAPEEMSAASNPRFGRRSAWRGSPAWGGRRQGRGRPGQGAAVPDS